MDDGFSEPPISEQRGWNLYNFVGNRHANRSDISGLYRICKKFSGSRKKYEGEVLLENEETKESLGELMTNKNDHGDRVTEVNKIVDIAPLLVIIENKVRENVVAATKLMKAGFADRVGILMEHKLNASLVNSFFANNTKSLTECRGAAISVLIKGLIDSLRDDKEYDSLDMTIQQIIMDTPVNNINEMYLGDWGYIQNYHDYLNKFPEYGDYQGENIIKTGNDKYWGFPNGEKSEKEWNDRLKLGYEQNVPKDKWGIFIGFDGQKNSFIDIATIFEKIFLYRINNENK